MRGRKPRPLKIARADLPLLQQIANSQIRPWYQVRCARILLGIADGARTQLLAFLTQCDASTVRRTCRHYEHLGLSGLLDPPTRSGRPITISPPATCSDCRTGLLGARFTPAHASWLDQAEILNNAFGRHYLRRGSWASREEFIAHIAASWPEYNEGYAHPFEWTWTNQTMR